MKTTRGFLIAGLLICSVPVGLRAAGDDTESAISQMGDAEIGLIQEHWGNLGEIGEGLGKLGDGFGKMLDGVQDAKDLYDAATALDQNECVPDFTTDASEMMPIGCGDDAACSQCYMKAVSRLDNVRKNLARMSCLRVNTKNYVDSAVAFGDDVSGIHGAMGLAWQNERRGIKASEAKFKKTYDGKYVEMIESLQIALKEISECESQFGMKDWYQKVGFIYFELMKEKYKRTD